MSEMKCPMMGTAACPVTPDEKETKPVIKSPVILDKTGVRIAEALEGAQTSQDSNFGKIVRALEGIHANQESGIVGGLRSIAAALWAEKLGENVEKKDVNFYDYDGKRVYSYTKAEFLGLSAMPANPAHTGLTAQGWNWTLEQAQTYVQKYEYLEIGQNYITDDGKTRLYVKIKQTVQLPVTLMFNQSIENGVTVDWGDGASEVAETAGNVTVTHTYAEKGNYIITLEAAEGCAIRLGQATGTGATQVATGANTSRFFTQGLRATATSSGREALVALEIGAGVNDIGSGALFMCTALETITVPNTVEFVRNLSMHGCINLKGFVVPSGVTQLLDYVFGYCYGIKAMCLPPTLTTLGIHTFHGCTDVARFTLPEGVTNLPNYVFEACYTADVIVLPDTIVGAAGKCAFAHCYGVESIKLPSGVTSIGDYAFDQCHALRVVELNEGITTIGASAFRSCFGFVDLVIPSTVTEIKKFAFLYNDGANTFHVKATTPPVLEPTAFTSIQTDIVIYVPYSEDHSILDAYLAATGWSGKGDNIREEDAE